MKIKFKILSTIFVILMLFFLFCINSLADEAEENSADHIITGDMNGDALVDEADAVYLLRHVLMPEEYPLSADGNVDGSGTIDVDDVTYLLKHIKSPGEYPIIGSDHAHTLEHFNAIAPTCKSEGRVEHWRCTVCKRAYLDEGATQGADKLTVSPIPHTEVTDEGFAPEIGVTGLTSGSHCSVCGDVIVAQDVIPALIGVIVNADQGITVSELEKSYKPGEVVSVVASVAEDYEFDGWFIGETLASADVNYTFTMPEESITLAAKCHIRKYVVSIEADEGISISGLRESYAKGDEVSLTASLAEGVAFGGWYVNGEQISSEMNCIFVMDRSEVTVEARVDLPHYIVSVTNGEGYKVEGIDLSYLSGEMVALSAEADEGYTFIGWRMGGEMISEGLTCSFAMPDEDVTVEPICYKIYALSVESSSTDLGSVKAPESAYETEILTVRAEAKEGCRFLGWFMGDLLVGTDLEYTFAMPSSDLSITARFDFDKEPLVSAWDGSIAEAFSGGEGTESDPYLISNGGELARLAYLINTSNENEYYNKHYRLTDNVDLGGRDWTPIGCYRYGNGSVSERRAFLGSFDGGGYTVRNFRVAASGATHLWYYGLFGYVGEGGTLKDLGVADFVMDLDSTGYVYVGGLAGLCKGDVFRCFASGEINATSGISVYAGGLIGEAQGNLTDCASDITAVAGAYGDLSVGGLVGILSGNIISSYSSSDVYATSESHEVYVGGLVGKQDGGCISSSLAIGDLEASAYLMAYAGGLVGTGALDATVLKSYRYSGQNISANGMDSVINEKGEVCGIERLDSEEFYKTDLSWSSSIWNYRSLDLASGVCPLLSGFVAFEEGLIVGEKYYLVTFKVEGDKDSEAEYHLVREGRALKLSVRVDEGDSIVCWKVNGEVSEGMDTLIFLPEESSTVTVVIEFKEEK